MSCDIAYPPSVSQYVATGTMPVATLLATFPPSASCLGMYARVSDLYGAVDDIMRCRWDGVNYRWVPQRESFSGNMASTGGAVSIMPLITPPTVRLSGVLSLNMTITPSTTNAYIGQRQRIVQNSTLGIFVTTITGILGSNITLLANSSKDIEYGPGGWFVST